MAPIEVASRPARPIGRPRARGRGDEEVDPRTHEERDRMSSTDELKNRVEAKKHDIKRQIAEMKADAGEDKRKRIEALESKLDELEAHLRSGWEQLSESVVDKLNGWLQDDAEEKG